MSRRNRDSDDTGPPAMGTRSQKRRSKAIMLSDMSKKARSSAPIPPAVVPGIEPDVSDENSGNAHTKNIKRMSLRLLKLTISAESCPKVDIPETLPPAFVKSSETEYMFTLAFDELDTFHRLAWAVPNAMLSIMVCLSIRDGKTGFCIHLLDDKGYISSGAHEYCWVNKPWDGTMSCTKRQNFLTYALGTELYELLSLEGQSLQSIFDRVNEISQSDPGISCIVCSKKLKTKMWRPTPCSPSCKLLMNSWSLEIRFSPLLLDHQVLDFLLCCCYTCHRETAGVVPLPAPNAKYICNLVKNVPEIIDSMPAITPDTCITDLIGSGALSDDRHRILDWFCQTFEGCLVSTPPEAEVALAEKAGAPQFILMNSNLKRHTAFMETATRSASKIGTPAFHTTPSKNLFSILADALASRYHGIFFADQPTYSLPFCRGIPLRTWARSSFSSSYVMFGLENLGIAKPPKGSEAHTMVDSEVAVRYVWTLPAASAAAGGPAAAAAAAAAAALGLFAGYGSPYAKLDARLLDATSMAAYRKKIREAIGQTFASIHKDGLGFTEKKKTQK